ncbi:MAG: rhombotarget lipoprotein [Burkholderiales bacterium]
MAFPPRSAQPLTLLLLLLAVALGGCMSNQSRQRASVVEYLYPDRNNPMPETGIPVLTLPIRVGLAFVPGGSGSELSEVERQELLARVASHFRQHPYVGAIELVPSSYVSPKGGFDNLEQIRSMLGADVIALVSYDQLQSSRQSALPAWLGLQGMTVWTLVGAYVIPNETNTTHTLMDTAVFDIASRKMLFRAPGTSRVKGSSNLFGDGHELRSDSMDGYRMAAQDMIRNLDHQLVAFADRTKERPEEYKVVKTADYKGGGDVGIEGLIGIVAVAGALAWSRRRDR